MLTLTQDDVLLGCRAADWRDALTQAGEALVAAGRAEAGYAEGLFAREAQSSTWLGQGIAIPHGTPESRRYVRATGVRVLQFPAGVAWHDGHRVHLLVAIAAQSDEHLDILRQLTHALEREDAGAALAAATDAEAVLAVLARPVVRARLDADTLCLALPVRSTAELALAAAGRLEALSCVGRDFVAAIATQAPLPLGQGLCLVRAAVDVEVPALALATAAHGTGADGVFGVFCLAAKGEAHQPLLARLDELLASGKAASLRGLSAETTLAVLAGEGEDTQTARVRLLNAHGLHARPAKQLVQVARAQGKPIRMRVVEGAVEAVPAISLTKVLGLGARRGQTLVFSARGDGAAAAVAAMVAAVEEGLGEAVTPLPAVAEALQAPAAVPKAAVPLAAPEPGQPLSAVPASPGLAVAPVYVLRAPVFDYPARSEDRAREEVRLTRALAGAAEQLEALIQGTQGAKVANILSVHVEMLADPGLRDAALEAIRDGASAEAGWWQAIDAAAKAQEALADRLLAERAADLRDVGRRVLGLLCHVALPEPPVEPYVLVAEDLGPSDVARLDTARVRGLVTARGGATSHSAILARALGIPAVVGAGERIMALPPGQALVVDGDAGRLVPAPDAARLARIEQRIAERQAQEREAYARRFEPAVTRDGHRIEVAANLGNTAHAADAVERGAEAVGLLRTEFVFMAHPDFPDLATQIGEYGEAFEALGGRPLVARTLDVGGDKPLPYWPIPAEDNPFLGMRGIRLALARPEVLETQLRALLIAAGKRPLRIMFPMVKDIEEFRAGKAIFDRLQAEIGAPDVQLGVMVEIPSSALLAPSLAAEVDFFSIGTNDLTQYCLAIDRGHAELSAQSDAIHPAVLRLIQMTVEAAHAHGRWVGVCGELGSDPLAVPVLVGLGVDELSVTARRVPQVKEAVRVLDLPQARELARLALRQPTAHAVRQALEAALPAAAELV
ncbi:phosphoenolpyruvate--protein phosphotransferase [Frateuria defendens]|uniref:phosphoenolpyruvate--protein phosphotransferase n=1 Tax=Frateuria defendens TaxID=2219559 RepID=UPI00066FDD04|nr:phosphoenolpyruvate--protein phosphotransferase [Frateuria defendens]